MKDAAAARAEARWSRDAAPAPAPLELVAGALNCAIYDLDLERGSVTWTGLSSAFGYGSSQADLRYSWWLERVHPEDREPTDRDYRDFIASGRKTWAAEYRFLAGDGTYRAVRDHGIVVRDSAGRVLRAVGTMVDVSDEKRLQADVQAAESRYRELVESLPLVTYVDEPGERAGSVYVSPQVEDMLGYSPAEWLRDPEFFSKVLHPSDRARVMEGLARPDDGTGRRSSEYRLVARDGRTVWVQDEMVVVRDAGGRALYRQGYVVDVTERKRMEATLRRRDAILEAVGFAAERFLGAPSWEDVIADVLVRLGEAASVSRIYIFENEAADGSAVITSQRHEWAAEGVTPEIDNPLLQQHTLAPDWAEKLAKGHVVHELTSEAPPEERAVLIDMGVRSLAIVPVFLDRQWWGLIGFDDCVEERDWSHSELDALRVAAGALGAAIQRERVEQGLQKANADFQHVAAVIKCAIYEWDAETNEIDWTEGITAAFGYSLDEVERTYEWCIERVHPEDRSRMDELARAASAGEREYAAEYRFRARDGGYRDVWDSAVTIRDEAGRPLRLVGGMLDITERKRAEAALRRSEKQYRVFFEASGSPMWVCDVETLRFLAVNEAAVTSYGYTGEEFLSMTAADLRAPEDVPEPADASTAYPDGASQTGIVRHRTKDGRLLDVSITMHVIDFEGRRAQLVVGYDVTEQRRLEDRLRQSQKMQAVGQLAGGIAHDFNNLLTVISGYGALALDRLRSGADPSEEIEEVRRAGDRAAALTRQLLAFSRQQVLQPVVLDLNSVIAELERLLGRVIGEDVELIASLEPELAPVRADPNQIEQVIMNLAVNARDAMPDGGKLMIETANVVVDEASVDEHQIPSGAYVVLAVTDTGIGLDQEVRVRMFEPFFTTKEPGKGTGLGLSTVYGIVEQSGGHIRVTSEPGRGAAFRVYLPSAVPVAERPAGRGPAHAADGGSETILLAEDEPVVAALVQEILEQAGYTIVAARSGAEALEAAAAHEGDIDLLLTDVVMPTMRGPELARRLLRERRGVKVLFMSGYTERAVSDRDALPDGQDFLGKPFSPSELTARARALLDRA